MNYPAPIYSGARALITRPQSAFGGVTDSVKSAFDKALGVVRTPTVDSVVAADTSALPAQEKALLANSYVQGWEKGNTRGMVIAGLGGLTLAGFAYWFGAR